MFKVGWLVLASWVLGPAWSPAPPVVRRAAARAVRWGPFSDTVKGRVLKAMVKNGMTLEQVRAILGDANEVIGTGDAENTYVTHIYWDYGISVVLGPDQTVVLQE